MAVDIADWTQAVNITGGSVTISGTASVSIVGTPSVTVTGTPTVNIGNTPAVTISSGTVNATITGTPNINITSQSVNLTVQTPWTARGTHVAVAGGSNFVTSAVAPGDTYMALAIPTGSLQRVSVAGVQSGVGYFPGSGSLPATVFAVTGWVEFPINGALDSTYRITYTAATGGGGYTIAAFSAPLTGLPALQGQGPMAASLSVVVANDQDISGLTNPPVWLYPNKAMVRVGQVGVGNLVIVAAVAGQTVRLFSGTVNVSVAGAGGVAQLLDTAGALYAEFGGDQTGNWPFVFNGVAFPVGTGLKWANAVAAITSRLGVVYSQS